MQSTIGQTFARASAAALVVVLALASCGGGKTQGSSSDSSPTATTGTTGTPGGTGTGSTPGTTGGATGGSTKPGGNPTPTGTSTFTGFARLDKACVRRGIDRQGLTGQTYPKGPYGYVTIYSNGEPYFDAQGGQTAGQGGKVESDEQGRFRETWVVPDLAPVGDAIVRVNTAEGIRDLPFTVLAQTGHCP